MECGFCSRPSMVVFAARARWARHSADRDARLWDPRGKTEYEDHVAVPEYLAGPGNNREDDPRQRIIVLASHQYIDKNENA